MILLIDWGNSYLKYILIPQLSIKQLSESNLNSIEAPEQLATLIDAPVELALVCSVRSEKDNKRLSRVLIALADKSFFAETEASACGIRCAYSTPGDLGIDRWLAVLAAESIAETVGVIDVGSAITVDIVNDKQHLGGHILPGKRLMLDSLLTTGRVRPDISDQSQLSMRLGESTSDCVNFAIDAAIKAYLISVVKESNSSNQIQHWVITGGGGHYWRELLANYVDFIEYHPLIVLHGLIRLYQSQLNE